MADIARLMQVIEPQASALGFEVVRVKLAGAGDERVLQVMAEDPATGQLVVAQCAALSRRISGAIDAAEEAGEELVEGAYNLEVSSPGIDRPLTRAADFAKWAGHEVNVTLSEPVGEYRKLRGDLLGIANGVVSVVDRRAGRLEFAFATIRSARLVLTDRLIAATRPLDMSGVEDIEEVQHQEKASN